MIINKRDALISRGVFWARLRPELAISTSFAIKSAALEPSKRA